MRPRQDYTHHVMLNDCVNARWSPMCQYSALTSLEDSHPLATAYSPESVRHQTLIGGYSSHFHTLVSVLPFQHFHLSTSAFSTFPKQIVLCILVYAMLLKRKLAVFFFYNQDVLETICPKSWSIMYLFTACTYIMERWGFHHKWISVSLWTK